MSLLLSKLFYLIGMARFPPRSFTRKMAGRSRICSELATERPMKPPSARYLPGTLGRARRGPPSGSSSCWIAASCDGTWGEPMILTENLRTAFMEEEIDRYIYELLPKRDAVIAGIEEY